MNCIQQCIDVERDWMQVHQLMFIGADLLFTQDICPAEYSGDFLHSSAALETVSNDKLLSIKRCWQRL